MDEKPPVSPLSQGGVEIKPSLSHWEVETKEGNIRKKRRILRKSVVIPAVIVLSAVGAMELMSRRDRGQSYDAVAVERRTVVQNVDVTGRVRPREQAALAFEESGTVESVYVAVGDAVTRGQALAALDTSYAGAQIAQAEAAKVAAEAQLIQLDAALRLQRAQLDRLRSGARTEEIRIAELAVARAEQVLAAARIARINVTAQTDTELSNAYDGLPARATDAFMAADDAMRNKIGGMFHDPDGSFPQIAFQNADFAAELDAENRIIRARDALAGLGDLSRSFPADRIARQNALRSAIAHMAVIRDFLTRLLDVAHAGASETPGVMDGYVASVTAARAAVVAALNALDEAERAIFTTSVATAGRMDDADAAVRDAERAVDSARAELDLKRAGTRSEEIAIQDANVRQAEANLAVQRAVITQAAAGLRERNTRLAKQTLRSPIDGIVTAVDVRPGEISSPGTIAIRVMSAGGAEVEAYIPEVDIAKVAVGNDASVIFDAYGRDVEFAAVVTHIDPAETMRDGVATYRAILQFGSDDARIRSGLSATVDVFGDRRDGVIAVPQRTVIRKDGAQTVRVLRGGTPMDVAVETGLRGSDGYVEILNGVSEGDLVIRATEE